MAFPVTIEKLIIGGQGLGHLPDGKVVLVPGVLPEEEVVVASVDSKKSFVQARLVDVVKPSSLRTEPPCPYYGKCGGCDFQYVHPAHQAELKNRILQEQLHRSGFGSRYPSFLQPPLPAAGSFRYRQRIRLHVDQSGRPGFLRHQSHQVEPITSCLLARPELNDALSFLVSGPSWRKIASLVDEIELLLSPEDEKVVVIFHLSRKTRPAEKKIFREIAAGHELIKSVLVFAAGAGMIDSLPGRQCGPEKPLLLFSLPLPDGNLRMTVEPGGFSQVNLEQNENLIGLLRDWAMVNKTGRVLDLFCGMGNFSLPLAGSVGSVTGMDLQRSAIRSAVRNAEINAITNCAFSQNSSLEGVRQLAENGEKFDLVLLDPPRQGCAEVIAFLPALAAAQIFYISCDPATLCRDLLLLEKQGYLIEKMKMVDMFPQTHHLETIVSLKVSLVG